jgi:hypothetical protein
VETPDAWFAREARADGWLTDAGTLDVETPPTIVLEPVNGRLQFPGGNPSYFRRDYNSIPARFKDPADEWRLRVDLMWDPGINPTDIEGKALTDFRNTLRNVRVILGDEAEPLEERKARAALILFDHCRTIV